MNNYYSRKFLLTLSVTIATTYALLHGAMAGTDAAIVYSAAIGSYNVMQGKIDANGGSVG